MAQPASNTSVSYPPTAERRWQRKVLHKGVSERGDTAEQSWPYSDGTWVQSSNQMIWVLGKWRQHQRSHPDYRTLLRELGAKS